MRRFLRSWRLVLRISALTFRAQLEYRTDFVMRIALGVAWQVSIIVFATVLLGNFPGMGGWPSRAVLLIAAMRMMSHAFFELFFGRSLELAALVQEGFVDVYLLRPMPVYRQVQLASFPSNAIGDLLVGVSISVIAVRESHLHWGLAHASYGVLALLGGTLVEAAIFTTLSSAHLHFPAASAWSNWVEELMGTFGYYPLKFLPTVISGAFTFVLPLAFIAYFPVAILTGNTAGLGVPVAFAAWAPGVGLLAYVGSRLIWNRSLRYYSGVNG